jgi:hypothetical protein
MINYGMIGLTLQAFFENGMPLIGKLTKAAFSIIF